MIGSGNGFGVSFLPNGDQTYKRESDQFAPGGRAPFQEPVSILNMRVPRVVGANPLAPLALLTGGGAGAMQPGQLEQLMRTLGMGPQMQTGQVPTTGAGPSVGGAPSPFAAMQSLMPTAGGAAPTVSVTAGMSDPGANAGGAMPPPAGPPAPMAPPMDAGGGGQDDGQALWELARRQREAMGRIAY